jgi:hypothetical protein
MDLPTQRVIGAAIDLMATLGKEGKGKEMLLAIQAATKKNAKILEQAQMALAEAGDLGARERAVAVREKLAEEAIQEQQRMRAAFYAYSESVET